MHRCPQCGRPTDGQYSDGGEFEDICDDCYLLEFLNGSLMTEEEITEKEAMYPDSDPGL
jgi:hypothetical protein